MEIKPTDGTRSWQINVSQLPPDLRGFYEKIFNQITHGAPVDPQNRQYNLSNLNEAKELLKQFIDDISNRKDIPDNVKRDLLSNLESLNDKVSKLAEFTQNINKLDELRKNLENEINKYSLKPKTPEISQKVGELMKELDKTVKDRNNIINQRSSLNSKEFWQLVDKIDDILSKK